MTEKTIVYAAIDYDYSSTEVAGIFSSREKALEWARSKPCYVCGGKGWVSPPRYADGTFGTKPCPDCEGSGTSEWDYSIEPFDLDGAP